MSLDAADLAARCLVHPITMKTGCGYRGPHTACCRTHLALRNRYTKLYDAAQTEMPAVGRLRAFGLEQGLNVWAGQDQCTPSTIVALDSSCARWHRPASSKRCRPWRPPCRRTRVWRKTDRSKPSEIAKLATIAATFILF